MSNQELTTPEFFVRSFKAERQRFISRCPVGTEVWLDLNHTEKAHTVNGRVYTNPDDEWVLLDTTGMVQWKFLVRFNPHLF